MTRDDILRMAREQGLPETEVEGVFRVNSDDLGRLLAAAKREWVGLTDEEVMVAAYQAGFDIHEDYDNEDDPEEMHWWTPDGEVCDDSLLKLRDIIEAKLKEKNT
jgi:hypothetical protein